MKPEVLAKRPVSAAEVKHILKKVQERDEELSFRGGKTQDYVNEIATISMTKAKEAAKKIEGLEIPRLKEEHIIKIIDTMPTSAEHLKVIMSGYNTTITKDNLQKIVDALDEYRK